MEIENTPVYFLINETICSENSHRSLHISTCFSEQINNWGNRSKISPCFRVSDNILQNDVFSLSGVNYFFFIGPLPLKKIDKVLLKDTYVWLGYGLYNIILATPSASKAEQIRKYLKQKNRRHESWVVEDASIAGSDYFIPAVCPAEELSCRMLEKYSADKKNFTAVRGYFTLIKDACERLRYIDAKVFERMILFHRAFEIYIFDRSVGES